MRPLNHLGSQTLRLQANGTIHLNTLGLTILIDDFMWLKELKRNVPLAQNNVSLYLEASRKAYVKVFSIVNRIHSVINSIMCAPL